MDALPPNAAPLCSVFATRDGRLISLEDAAKHRAAQGQRFLFYHALPPVDSLAAPPLLMSSHNTYHGHGHGRASSQTMPALPPKVLRRDVPSAPSPITLDDGASSSANSASGRGGNSSMEYVGDTTTAPSSVCGGEYTRPSSTVPFDQARLDKLNARLQSGGCTSPERLQLENTIRNWEAVDAARPPLAARPLSPESSVLPRSSEDEDDGPQVVAPEDRITAVPERAHVRESYAPVSKAANAENEKLAELGLEPKDLSALVTKMPVVPRYEAETELSGMGRRDITRQKYVFTAFIFSVNFMLIFAVWWWPRYYYIYLPIITFTVALNCLMVISLIVFGLWYLAFPEKPIMPESPETMVFLMPCYNETLEECTKSLDSLVNQTKIDEHKRSIMIICDGRVRGPGMAKTTAQYLFEDILVERTSRKLIRGAYMAWDHQDMDVEIQKGMYKGVPYFCIVKQQNQGKRDGLIVLRSFLYNFNRRAENPAVIFSPRFFGEMASFLANDAGIDNVTHLIGMDADTVFAEDCIYELLQQSRYKHTVGVCGYVAVDFSTGKFNPWALYQSSEYTISQGLRRLHQSKVTNKVSCLPGCCQLLRICETTCGDKILVELFGYCPKPHDGLLKQIRATASEDRNHVCLMLTTFPEAQTRQALKARAYTDVPRSWSVFLSQRRRWTLGATSNDLMLITAPGVQWFERILAFGNVLTWTVNLFIMASLACLIKAILFVEWWIILAFASVMLVPFAYTVCIVFWLPPTPLDKFRYILGLFMYVTVGMFLNIFVLLYAVFNVDSFGWGKTRKVVAEDPDAPAVRHSMDAESIVDANASTVSFGPDILAVLPGPRDTALLDRFGRHYKTLAYCPAPEAAAVVTARYPPRGAHTVGVAAEEADLEQANAYILPVHIDSPSATAALTSLAETLTMLSRHLTRGDTLILAGVLPVGQTRSLLAGLAARGIHCGFVASAAVGGTTKVLAALDDAALVAVEQLYARCYTDTVAVPWVEVAEMWQSFVGSREGVENAVKGAGDPRRVLEAMTESWKGLQQGWKGLEKATDMGVVVSEREVGSESEWSENASEKRVSK
ncbi:chitin synthase-domain-containing protein [Geopyxis carbonaria]|nr:chitin synthase-domain-containing protein [Geopyxis carbonaria]